MYVCMCVFAYVCACVSENAHTNIRTLTQTSHTRSFTQTYARTHTHTQTNVASLPGSPSFRAIIPRMTFDPPEGKAEGEPGKFVT